jgi:hypothetical protein
VASSPTSDPPASEHRTPNTEHPAPASHRFSRGSQPREYDNLGLGDDAAWEEAASFLLPEGYQADVPAAEPATAEEAEAPEERQQDVQEQEQVLNTHGSGKSDPIQENGDRHEG